MYRVHFNLPLLPIKKYFLFITVEKNKNKGNPKLLGCIKRLKNYRKLSKNTYFTSYFIFYAKIYVRSKYKIL